MVYLAEVHVRIVRSVQRPIDGIDAAFLQKGELYDLSALAANVLIAEGVAILEMRRGGERRQHSSSLPPTIAHDRRTRRRR